METNTLTRQNSDGSTTVYTEEVKGIPAKYVMGAVVAVAGLVLLFKGNKKGKPSFFRQYVTPLIMAAAYKKVMEVIENKIGSKDAEIPAHSGF